jgi:nucleolar protein 56
MLTREDAIRKAKQELKKEYSKEEYSLIQAVRSVEDLEKAKNLLIQRIKEWFNINFPEIIVFDEKLLEIINVFSVKENLEQEKLSKIVGDKKAVELMINAKNSFGAKLQKEDAEALQKLSMQAASIDKTITAMEDYIKKTCEKVMPNTTSVVGAVVASKLLSKVGDLEKLAKMPASTIQVLGAEKALFKHLKSNSKPPKHGLIFQNAFVSGAAPKERGKRARKIAAKIAIALKADAFTHHDITAYLK